jgi:Zn-dependent protease with chaperone function
MEASPDFLARYADGEVAEMRDVICHLEGAGLTALLTITDMATRKSIANWPVEAVFPAHGRNGELRFGAGGRSSGARVVVRDRAEIVRARNLLPGLGRKQRRDRFNQGKFLGVSTAVLGAVVLAYIYGVPLLAGDIVNLVPPAMEKRLGDTVAAQMQKALSQSGGFQVCDPDPNSIANLAINRFANAALQGTGTPFTADVTVIRTTIPNAFALPGGKAFYFSGLLDHTETADEFAGVLAHEMGHVVHRDGMQQLISTASTGLLIGFILGDMTGLSIAGTLGTTLVDTRFSREAERNADHFAVETAKKLKFQPIGLANLLERVAADDSFSQAMAFLSTHPLTIERRAALEALRPADDATLQPAFTDSEWRAIKGMCGSPAGSSKPAASGTITDAVPAPSPDLSPSGPSDSERQRDKSVARS